MKLLNLLLCLLISGFAQNTFAQDITTRTEKFEGNTISISVQIDTIQTWDAMTGEQVLEFEKHEKIEELNGHSIYYNNGASEPVGGASQSDIRGFITELVNEELNSRKGVDNIDVIIDEEGKLAFIRYRFIKGLISSEKEIESISNQIIKKLKGIKFIPAKRNGKAVPYGIDIMPGKNITTITETFEGNTLYIRVQRDTIRADCFIDGREYMIEQREKMLSLNDKDVYSRGEASEPVGASTQRDFLNYMTKVVQDELNASKDVPHIHAWMDIVIDEKGELAFLRFIFFDDDEEADRELFREGVKKIIKARHFVPARHNGKAVPYATRIGVNNNF